MEDIKAVQLFKSGNNCAQSVFAHFSNKTDITEFDSIKLATGFGSGMGRLQEVCGALSGGILVLSSIYGKNEIEYKPDLLYEKIQILFDGFQKEYNTNKCIDLLGNCNLRTPAGQIEFKTQNKIEICYGCVKKVISILDGLV